jgi:PAS domain S-box-containing protein
MGEVYVPSFYGGKGATVRVTASPLIGENGNIYGAIESVRDISHLKKAEDALKQSEEKYRTIFDHGVLGIFQSTLQGRFISINMAFAKMLGFNSPEETIDSIHNISEQFYLDQSRRKLILEELINSNEIKTYAEKFKSRSGKIWVGNLNVRLVRDSQNNPKYLEGFIEDITENKEYEQKLIEAKEKAEESERLKSAFLANMSHEIRTPLNGILGFASLLEQDDLETSKRSKFIHIINTNSRQLLQIINDILDFSKIEVGQLIIVESDVLLEDLIRELHALFSEQIENEGKLQLNFQLEGEAELSNLKVLTDGGRLKQILYNLLSNAIKFTNKGNITLGFQKPDDSNILFYVKDTGIGIPKEMHQQIFDRFRQVDDAHTRQFGGTGLGLAISKELIKLMKGEIWLESELGKGTVFYIKIPYKPIIES